MNQSAQNQTSKSALISLLTFMSFICFSYWTTSLDAKYSNIKQESLSFTNSDFIPTDELDNLSVAEIKLNQIKDIQSPNIGVFGHHVVNRFSKGILDSIYVDKTFFNYHFRHISLEEQFQLLLFLEKNKKLPSEYLFMYLSHPVFGRHHYFDSVMNMPVYIYNNNFDVLNKKKYSSKEKVSENLFSDFKHNFSIGLNTFVDKHLDWKNVFHAIGTLVFGDCAVEKNNNFKDTLCSIKNSKSERGWYKDGSALAPPKNMPKNAREVRGTVYRTESEWSPDDKDSIAILIKNINELGIRNNLNIIFFMPPTYEKLHDGISNRIIDDVFMNMNNILFFDDRANYRDKNLFYDPDHPGQLYYEELLKRADVY